MLKGDIMTKTELKKNIWKYYIFCFLRNLAFHAPIFMIYLTGYLSLAQVMIMESVAAITTIVFEVPSGAFAEELL